MDKLFNKDDKLIIFDVGAAECEDSILYSKYFKNALIFAFEALPLNFNTAIESVNRSALNNIRVFNSAISDVIGNSEFHVSEANQSNNNEPGHYSSSLLPPADDLTKRYNYIKFDNIINVKTTTIKKVCEENSIDIIDFIHMDIQGAELLALKGAGDKILKTKAIWLEMSKISLYKNQPLNNEIDSYFKEHNFVLFRNSLGSISGNRLYVNSNYYSKNFIYTYRFLGFVQRGYRKLLHKLALK